MPSSDTRADRFRAAVGEIYDLDADPFARELVNETAAVMREVDQLAAAAATTPPVEVRQGGSRESAVWVALRLRRDVLSRLLKSFPAVDE